MSVNNSKQSAYLPFFFAFTLLLGVLVGTLINFTGNPLSLPRKSDKIGRLLQIIDKEYVDEVNTDSLSELAIATLLSELDPHSTYIPPTDLQQVNEDMEGNFEGVGIEFNLMEDTINVATVISGGPSEKAGIMPGDRIVEINGEKVAGIGIKNEEVIKKLRGKRGTKVKVGIKRKSVAKLLEFEIKRDKIPLYSVDASFMLNKETGYIKISRFSATTFEEYENAMDKLRKQGMKKLMLDLRGNPGGYLDQAVDLVDDFLKKDEMIVYTQGKNRKKQEYTATSKGNWEDEPLAILIDETSASASEIVAGAIQDQDRAPVIGRRSFGKGLVQEQMELEDGSAMRLTVARYYTPSGRSIQRPYSNGTEAYYLEVYERMGGKAADSSETAGDTVKYYTKNKRVVYGGGGVRPDFIVPEDSSLFSEDMIALYRTNAINRFAFDYTDKNRDLIQKSFPSYSAFARSNEADTRIKSALSIFLKAGSETQNIQVSKLGLMRVKANIARNIWGNEAYYFILAVYDADVLFAEKKLSGI